MQPFNLEKALAGAKLVTRDAREVAIFKRRSTGESYDFVAYMDGAYAALYTDKGRYWENKESDLDLFLADEPTPHIFITEMEKFLNGSVQDSYPKKGKLLLQHFNQFIEDYPQFKNQLK